MKSVEEGGAAPLTQACLQNQDQVYQEIVDAEDTANNTMQIIQLASDRSTFFLKEHGFNSDVLKILIKKVKTYSDGEAFTRMN